jgi:hypothetical protein
MMNTSSGKNVALGIGYQFLNVLNHPNFGRGDNITSDSTFGQIQFLTQPPTGILGAGSPSRMIQLTAQLRF